MTPLLIATSNPAKLAEYRLLLRQYPFELLSLRDLGISAQPEESGATFSENALIKARFYFDRAKTATLADDGGLQVDALDGAPGVHSRRWLGDQADDRMLAEEVVRRMAGLPAMRRTARIRCALALVYCRSESRVERITEAAIEGVIGDQVYLPVRPGFPYRSVLYLPERRCFLGELGEQEEARIGQRKVAIDLAHKYLSEISSADVAGKTGGVQASQVRS